MSFAADVRIGVLRGQDEAEILFSHQAAYLFAHEAPQFGQFGQYEQLEQLDLPSPWANTRWKGSHESPRNFANRRCDPPR